MDIVRLLRYLCRGSTFKYFLALYKNSTIIKPFLLYLIYTGDKYLVFVLGEWISRECPCIKANFIKTKIRLQDYVQPWLPVFWSSWLLSYFLLFRLQCRKCFIWLDNLCRKDRPRKGCIRGSQTLQGHCHIKVTSASGTHLFIPYMLMTSLTTDTKS